MNIYFAHPISLYDTRKESVLIDMISRTSWLSYPTVLNPNSEYHEGQYQLKGMDYFLTLVDSCDALVIYPFEDGSIGAGIVKEALRAVDSNKKVYLINPDTFEMSRVDGLKNCLTVEETKEKLKKIRTKLLK